MRERLYIATTKPNWTNQECLDKSDEFKNVIMYSPDNKSIYLNGSRYGAINGIDENLNGSILFELSEDEFHMLHITQRDLSVENHLVFNFFNGEIGDDTVIKCHVGERIQILSNTPVNIYNNKQYYWKSTSNSVATIDRNNIITPLKVSALRTQIILVNINDDSDILFSIKLLIYEKNRPFDNPASMSSTDIENGIYNMEDNYHGIIWNKVDDETKDEYPFKPFINNNDNDDDGNHTIIDPYIANNVSNMDAEIESQVTHDSAHNIYFVGRIDYSTNKVFDTVEEYAQFHDEIEHGELHDP